MSIEEYEDSDDKYWEEIAEFCDWCCNECLQDEMCSGCDCSDACDTDLYTDFYDDDYDYEEDELKE